MYSVGSFHVMVNCSLGTEKFTGRVSGAAGRAGNVVDTKFGMNTEYIQAASEVICKSINYNLCVMVKHAMSCCSLQ